MVTVLTPQPAPKLQSAKSSKWRQHGTALNSKPTKVVRNLSAERRAKREAMREVYATNLDVLPTLETISHAEALALIEANK